MICVDNSEYMRNGDFLPTRLQAQQDAVNLVTQSKLRSNPESNVGLLTLSGLDVLVTLTTDSGKVLAQLHGVQPKGQLQLISGIKIAHLALKHRQGKNHKTRIVMFIGSPIGIDEKDLLKCAKKLKKEKVNVDIVSFGEDSENAEMLTKFIEAINGRDGTGSNLVTIPPGPNLSDALISSKIVQGEDGSNVVASGGGFEFGIDPNEDPELALALRVSMEEQRARQEAENRETGGPATGATPAAEAPAAPASVGMDDGSSEEALLQRALEMSMNPEEPGGSSGAGSGPPVDLGAMTEDEQIAYAMRMSMAESGPSTSGGAEEESKKEESMEVDETASEPSKQDEDYSEVMSDPAFLQNVLENLPGVDPGSEAIRSAMGAMTGETDKKDDEKKSQDDKKDKQ